MIKPLGDRVVIELVKQEEKTASGIVLPDSAQDVPKIEREVSRLSNMIKQIGDPVVIKLVKQEEKTASGLVQPDSAQEVQQEATKIAVGAGSIIDGKKVPLEVEEGNHIIYAKYAGTEVEYDGNEYLIIREDDILAVIE